MQVLSLRPVRPYFCAHDHAHQKTHTNAKYHRHFIFLTAMQLVMGVICAGFDGDIAVPNAQALPYVLLIGVAGLLAHFCLTNALSIAPATVVVPIDFIRLPVIAIVGMLVYQEALDIWVFVGAGVIL